MISPARVPTDTSCPKAGCTLDRRPDGGVELRTDLPALRVAESIRPDGTHMQVSANRPDRSAAPPLVTVDQLMAIARAPALTLFP